MRYFLPAALLFAAIFSNYSCQIDRLTAEERFVKDTETINDYLADNNLVADTVLASGLQAIFTNPGTGQNPGPTTKVTVAYRGYLPNGKVFDESSSAGIEFGLNQVIEGWTTGIPLFKKGGSGTLLIPSHLGYGSRSPSSDIPSHSVLIFDIQLLDF